MKTRTAWSSEGIISKDLKMHLLYEEFGSGLCPQCPQCVPPYIGYMFPYSLVSGSIRAWKDDYIIIIII